jgi:hypothetical protein
MPDADNGKVSTEPNRIVYFAETTHRNAGVRFGIKQADRRSHFYIVGKTGTGKSHLLRFMLLQDITNGDGCMLIDPHGDLARSVLSEIPSALREQCLWCDFSDPETPWRLNPLQAANKKNGALLVAGIIETFSKLWPDGWGPRSEHVLRNALFTLLEVKGSTLADIGRLLSDRSFRESIVPQVRNSAVKEFWTKEYDRYSPGFRSVVAAPLQNKLGALLTNPITRTILTQPGDQLELNSLMDHRKIVLVNLDKGRIGAGPAEALGSLLLTQIGLAGLARSQFPEQQRKDFVVYVDEFHLFTTLALVNMLAELRKFRVALVLANQHLAQLQPAIREAVLGNTGTLVSFRVGGTDAGLLVKEFAPVFSATDLTTLPKYEIYVRLLIDGIASRPFSARTLAP